jgi:nitrite reductase (NADH) small subunit
MTTIESPLPVTMLTDRWTDVGPVGALTPDRGIAVLVDGHQVAVFLLSDGSLHAIDNHDPVSGANVLSRGLVGDRGGVPLVASPIYKQGFELATGRCLDEPWLPVQAHHVAVSDGRLLVSLSEPTSAAP